MDLKNTNFNNNMNRKHNMDCKITFLNKQETTKESKQSRESNFIFNPMKNEFYEEIGKFFSNPILEKLKDINNTSMYIVKFNIHLLNDSKYLSVFVPKDNEVIGFKKPLKDLYWISLSTHNSPQSLTKHQHVFMLDRNETVLEPITFVEQDNGLYIYSCDKFGLSIILDSKNNKHVYSKTGSIATALNTFNCTISFV